MLAKLIRLFKKPPGEIAQIVFRRFALKMTPLWRRLNPIDLSLKKFLAVSPFSRAGRFSPGRFFSSLELPGREGIFPDMVKAAAPETIAAADRACDHIFDFLGSGPVDLGPKINWHRDFKDGKVWPKLLKDKLELIDPADGSDVKVPWELSRFQHLTAMGRAYLLTGDEKYPAEFALQIEDWLAENPCGVGVNWACTMDVAIRAANWIWAYHFFKDSASLSDDFWLKFFHSLYVHGRFIRANLEWGTVRGNHYLSDIVGLVYLGVFFQGAAEGQKWLTFSVAELEKEIEHQVYSDGVDHEASTSYQRLVVELFLSAAVLLSENGIKLSDGFNFWLEKMLDFVRAYTKPDGTIPLFGDADDGRLQILSEETRCEINDHRYLLAIGTVLFDRPDFKRAAGKFWEEAWWLLGERGRRAFEALSEQTAESEDAIGSTAFAQGGFYFMRHDDRYLAIDCGPVGLRGGGGHGHNDALSVEIFAEGQSLITDSGSYVYTADPAARNEFRGTAAHNVIALDGREMADLGEADRLWTIADQAKPRCLLWEPGAERDVFVGEHEGYCRFDPGARVRRTVIFDKEDGFWWIKDCVYGERDHVADLFWHFRPGEFELTAAGEAVGLIEGVKIAVRPLESKGLKAVLEPSWWSPSYGVRRPAQRLRYRREGRAPLVFSTLIATGANKERLDLLTRKIRDTEAKIPCPA